MLCMVMTELDLQLCQSSPRRNLIRESCLGAGVGVDASRPESGKRQHEGKLTISRNLTGCQETAVLQVAYLHPHPVSVNSSCGQSNCCNKKLQSCQALQNEMSIYVEVSVSDSQKASHCKGLREIIWRGAGGICSGTQLTRVCTDNHAFAGTTPAKAKIPSRSKWDGLCWWSVTSKPTRSQCVTACRSA